MTDGDLDLEAEYNNRARVAGSARLIAGWARDAAAYRAEAEAAGRVRRLAYGAGERHVVDLFEPETEAAPGVVVAFVHGGYWQALSPDQFSHLARGLVARGIRVGVVGYDLCPAVRVGDIVEQVREACLLLGRGSRLVVAGHSAGGHLAACMLATDWAARGADPDLVPAAYALSGLFELAPLVPTTVNAPLRMDVAEAERLSPLAWAPPRGRVLDAVVGGEESGEYLRQSRAIVDAWGREGVETRYEALPGLNHFTVVAPLADPDSAMTGRIAELASAARAA
jgi:arylformamidase